MFGSKPPRGKKGANHCNSDDEHATLTDAKVQTAAAHASKEGTPHSLTKLYLAAKVQLDRFQKGKPELKRKDLFGKPRKYPRNAQQAKINVRLKYQVSKLREYYLHCWNAALETQRCSLQNAAQHYVPASGFLPPAEFRFCSAPAEAAWVDATHSTEFSYSDPAPGTAHLAPSLDQFQVTPCPWQQQSSLSAQQEQWAWHQVGESPTTPESFGLSHQLSEVGCAPPYQPGDVVDINDCAPSFASFDLTACNQHPHGFSYAGIPPAATNMDMHSSYSSSALSTLWFH
ncbi:hypothetical protein BaRGS_00001291 [Batillaria attramentaria]|uniref:Uncharacterized protein n=1 Tax=Batillaria attramentaria TaxID=370345 RepID=A0ABD0M6S1_9CAEN